MTSSYFSHDSNARNSKKLLRLRKKHGAAGYGVYFMLIEKLMETDERMLDLDYDMLAFDLRVKKDFIKSVVENFGLFEFRVGKVVMNSDELQMNSDELQSAKFFSSGLQERMELSKKRAEAGRRGAEKRWETTPQLPQDNIQDNIDDMANNGKSIASQMANEDFANGKSIANQMAKRGNKKGVINNPQNKKYINNSLFFMFSPFFDGKTAAGETKQIDLGTLYYLVLERNMPRAEAELEKLIAYNNVQGKSWEIMTPEQRIAAATLWQPRDNTAKGSRFSKGFLGFWHTLVDKLIEQSDGKLIYQALSDGITEGVGCSDKSYELKVTNDLYACFEEGMDKYKDIIFSYIQKVGCEKLMYNIID